MSPVIPTAVSPRSNGGVQAKILLGFVVALALFVLICAVAYLSVQRFMETSRWVNHTYQVINLLQRTHAHINQVEAAHRGHLLTGEADYLRWRDQAAASLRQDIQTLAGMTPDNPRQQGRLHEISQRIDSRLRYFDRMLADQGDDNAAQMRRTAQEELHRDDLVRMRALIDEMLQEERALLTQRTSEEEEHARTLIGFFALLLVLVAVFLTALFLRIRHDLALRRRVELEQKRLTDILDATPDYIATATLDGKYLYLNQGGRQLVGLGADEDVAGLTISGMHPEWASKLIHQQGIPAAISTGSWIGETAFLTRTGLEFPTSQVIIAHRNPDGTPAYLSTIARDISEQKQVEQEITQAARYDKTHGEVLRMFNANFDRIGMLDDMLHILAANHPLPVSAVYLYDEWSGMLTLAASHAAPADIAREIALGEGLVGTAALENRVVCMAPSREMSDLAIATGLLAFAPAATLACPIVYQEKRQGVLVVAASADLGERDQRFLERLCGQLAVALHNVQQFGDLKLLAEQLRLRSEEISSKNAQLEEANRMKSEFLANMSHELRTPLNAIIGFSEVMRDGLTGALNARQQEYVSDICESGQHLLELINDVLDLSKIEAGRMELDEEMTEIGALLANSLAIVKEKAASHQLKLHLDIAQTVGACLVDPRKLKQMVYNLLSNAVKFTPEGGEVRLHAGIVSRAQVISSPGWRGTPLSAEGDEFLEIVVSDTGIGIAPEDAARLFEPFVQLDSSLARRFEGTGLGLAMVRRLAELHGGAVGLASQSGAGSTFSIWLPYRVAAAARPAPATDSHAAPLRPGGTPRVLVIEDDDQAAELIRLQLEASQCRVVRATTAEMAMTMLNDGLAPDVISLDILLPGMDGWEFLGWLKRMPQFSQVPVVIMSIVAEQNRNRGISLGASQVLQKPVSGEELAAALDSLGIASPALSREPATVLVVDDDPRAVEIVASHLEHARYSVLRAYGGEEGIQLAHASEPDLIVLDLMMPGVSGFEVAESLKQQQATATIPILVLTAKLLSAADRELLNGHVMRVMQKSEFNHGNFINEVRRALAGCRERPLAAPEQEPPWPGY